MKCTEPNGRKVEIPDGSTIRGTIHYMHSRHESFSGYGFILGDGVSYFFLPSSVIRSEGIRFSMLQKGQSVEFVAHAGDRGPYATEVRVIV